MLPNPGNRLYPGMYAQVALETVVHHNALTLPASAIGTDGSGKFVYAVQQGRIVRQPVQTGMSDAGVAEVVGGLSGDELVLSSVQGAPAPGTTVKAVPHI